jgi:hypothetical protein
LATFFFFRGRGRSALRGRFAPPIGITAIVLILALLEKMF